MKIKYVLGLAISSLLFLSSCSDSMMDKINTDERHPSLPAVDGKFQITDGEVATVYSVLCGNYAWYVSSFTEQEFGTNNNQLKDVEARLLSEIAASSSFANEWNSTYLNIYNISSLRKKCETGVNKGQYDLMGMAQTLEALNWGVLTDLHGDVPMSECFSDVSAPKIDTQKAIYDSIFAKLDAAQANFVRGASMKNGVSQDVIFKGDLQQWSGLAHALKARYLLHTYGVNKTDALLRQVLSETDAALAAGFKGANLNVFDTGSQNNSWYAYWFSREYIGSSTTVDNLLKARNDPREPIYNYACYKGMTGADTVATPGDAKLAAEQEGVNVPAFYLNPAAYEHLFSKSELYFIRAEVKARLNENAKPDFEAAVTAAMDDWQSTGGKFTDVVFDSGTINPANITATDVQNYLNNINALYLANPLKEILVQKYIAQTRDEQLETYNDMRRCKFVDGSYPVTMVNPNNNNAAGNRWPLRLPYGNSDVISNPNVKKAFGSGNDAGMYIFTKPVWWAGGQQ